MNQFYIPGFGLYCESGTRQLYVPGFGLVLDEGVSGSALIKIINE